MAQLIVEMNMERFAVINQYYEDIYDTIEFYLNTKPQVLNDLCNGDDSMYIDLIEHLTIGFNISPKLIDKALESIELVDNEDIHFPDDIISMGRYESLYPK